MSLARRFASLVLPSLLGVALMSGLAHADVAPPDDGGGKQDMTSTMAKPDLSTPVNTTNDDGCSMSGHREGSAAGLVAVSAVALALLARRRRTA